MKLIYSLLLVLTFTSSWAQDSSIMYESPAIKKKENRDSVFIEFSFNDAGPVAAKLYFTIDTVGNKAAEVFTYTHQYRTNKLLTKKYVVSVADSLIQELLMNEKELLTKADSTDGYIVDWLDGSTWSIIVEDRNGRREYTYPELFDQSDKEDIKRVQQLFTYLDARYRIEEKSLRMKLKRGKYHNYGETIREIK